MRVGNVRHRPSRALCYCGPAVTAGHHQDRAAAPAAASVPRRGGWHGAVRSGPVSAAGSHGVAAAGLPADATAALGCAAANSGNPGRREPSTAAAGAREGCARHRRGRLSEASGQNLISTAKERRGHTPRWAATPCDAQAPGCSQPAHTLAFAHPKARRHSRPSPWQSSVFPNPRLAVAMLDPGSAVRDMPRNVSYIKRSCTQVAPAPGSRRVVSTEWTAAGIRAAANAGDKAVARTRRRTGLQRHGSVASALEASPWCQLTRVRSQSSPRRHRPECSDSRQLCIAASASCHS